MEIDFSRQFIDNQLKGGIIGGMNGPEAVFLYYTNL
jgi:hypothetical protein